MEDDPVLKLLEHSGVKGMRWGVRRSVGPNGRVTNSPKPKSSEDHDTIAPLRRKPIHSLSNAELKKVNERMNLEKNYKKLNPTTRDKGKQHVDSVLKNTIGTGLGAAAVFKLASDPKVQKVVKDIIKDVSPTQRLLRNVSKNLIVK
jgi:hypothetical protein